MKASILPTLVLLTACTTQPASNNPFDAQVDFAAQREAETVVIEDMDRETACAHVTEVLMDLECVLTEINSDLGLIAAETRARLVPADSVWVGPTRWNACAGNNVTVSVTESKQDRVFVRATFDRANPDADWAFKALLRRSIAQQAEK